MVAAGKKTPADLAESPDWPFGRKNYILLGVSLVIIIIGYICLGYGDDPNNFVTLTLAPILLVIGYLLVPFAIMARDKAETDSSEPAEQ